MFPFVRVTFLGLPMFVWIYVVAAAIYAGATWPRLLRRGISWWQCSGLLIYTVLLALLGGKLYALIDGWFYYKHHPEALLSVGGHGWNGVFSVVMLGLAVLFLFWKGRALRYLDTIVLFAPIGISIGRIGCLVTADGDYGTPTDLPWGMTFEHGYFPTEVPVHPTPIYEMLVMIPLFVLLKTKVYDRLSDGWTLAIYLLVYAVERFAIELIRWNREIALGMTLPQWTCIIYMVVALAIVARLVSRRGSSHESHAE
jgi:phosphatidylglycerol:prolipoprotein diacylglycerol transferase